IELNISCPNVKQGGMAFGTTTDGAASVVEAVRKVWPHHLMVKLSPNVTSIAEIARAVEGAGADSVSLINTLLGMAIDVERRRPFLSTITGGLSGPAVKPVAVRMVWQVAKAVAIPVVGLGGISCAADALEFIMAGATAVQIGTANFTDPTVTVKVIEGIEDYCRSHNVASISELRGIILKSIYKNRDADRSASLFCCFIIIYCVSSSSLLQDGNRAFVVRLVSDFIHQVGKDDIVLLIHDYDCAGQ
ncbi:MAG: dihydroorotate dehydrogenase, partial [Muribaculaceae bacterium]|nr:dihydroorotate dehydrogenase [Muribaculaceae bacterium]